MVNLSSACPVAFLVLGLFGATQAFIPVGGGTSTHATITGNAVISKIAEVCQAVAESEGREFNPTGSSAEELLRACLGTATGEVSAAKFHTALNQIYMQNGLVDRDSPNSPAHHFNNEAFVQARTLITEGTDFYSHSNWVELGNKSPYATLLRADLPINNVAGWGCWVGMLIVVFLLTGKCSHGGASDMTSTVVPRGGISKDERRADNAALHDAAVAVATQATLDLLEDIRGAAGNKEFLRLMGIARSSVLCFVIDTTGSMADDIAEAKRVATNIIDSKKGTVDEPSEYILVQFNDPHFGPLIRTTDPDVMKKQIAALGADGGGDIPEMCLSGLQVNIFMTASKRTLKYTGRVPRSDFRVYYDLALASGGSAIEVSKASLPQATEIIVDSSTSALVSCNTNTIPPQPTWPYYSVTILQRARNPGRVETFPFLLDESVSNVTLYITGNLITFTLRGPTGQSTITFVYDFVETFKGPHPGYGAIDGRPEAGLPTQLLLTLSSRHGPESLKVTEAALVEVSGTGVANGTVEEVGGGNYLVSVNRAPAGEFVVLLKGKDTSTSSLFQRQSTTQMAVTTLTVKVVADNNMEPGTLFDIPFIIHSSVPKTNFNIRATNDKDYAMTYPTLLGNNMGAVNGSMAEGTLKITVPSNTASGTDVTLTINVESAGTSESNYAVVRLSVVKKVTDFSPPLCTVVNINNSCPTNCSASLWFATVNITDGNGTGVQDIYQQQGQMDLVSTNKTENGGVTVIHNTYQVSCCTPDLKLTVTDKEGNVGSCFHSIRPPTTPVPLTTPHSGQPPLHLAAPLWMCLLLSATAIVRDILPLTP
ncbi:hypothetical protein ACEWY4_006587 [Coilia grayii]|uniref:von Willebrand factor A domain-containing protein 7-like n=1 Tax=Coilia grayii TaxID=363190 RepID=A0ABD1KE02_9TELE